MRRQRLAGAALISLTISASPAVAQQEQQPGSDQPPAQQQRLDDKEQDQGIKTGQASPQQQLAGESSAGKIGELTADQRAKIHQALREQNVETIDRPDFPVKLGAHIPETVKHHQIPIAVLDIAPRLRGYDYVRIGNQIAFVNPGTREIVGILSS